MKSHAFSNVCFCCLCTGNSISSLTPQLSPGDCSLWEESVICGWPSPTYVWSRLRLWCPWEWQATPQGGLNVLTALGWAAFEVACCSQGKNLKEIYGRTTPSVSLTFSVLGGRESTSLKLNLMDAQDLSIAREVGKKLLVVNVIDTCLLLDADRYKGLWVSKSNQDSHVPWPFTGRGG